MNLVLWKTAQLIYFLLILKSKWDNLSLAIFHFLRISWYINTIVFQFLNLIHTPVHITSIIDLSSLNRIRIICFVYSTVIVWCLGPYVLHWRPLMESLFQIIIIWLYDWSLINYFYRITFILFYQFFLFNFLYFQGFFLI